VTAKAPAGRLARRTRLVALCSLAVFVAYTDRVNISVAAVAMKERLGWTQTEKGLVLSSFFIGYLAFMFASGWLATRFGGRRVLGVAVIAWSACTLLTPPAAALSLGALVTVRIAMGLGEAAVFPAAIELYGRWVPLLERTRAVGWLMNGIPIGTVVGLTASGWLVGRYDWPMPFYVFGALGLGWAVLWFRTVADDPATDPRISAVERALLADHGPGAAAGGPMPWRRLLCRAPLWAAVSAHFASIWTLYVLLSWLPSYFREVHGVSIASVGLYSAGPWLAMFLVTTIAAPISDALVRRGVDVTLVRKLMQCAGLATSAALLLAARDVHAPGTAFLVLCGATGALGLTWLGYAPGLIDLAPRHSALLIGFSNTIATIPGIVGVAVTGWLVDLTGTYAAPFALTAAISAVGAVTFATLFSARPLVE
jgi:MFS transporter, ACS family, solute carrier family 17 (sodium-dependent inorganic phosphate cotransporter), other